MLFRKKDRPQRVTLDKKVTFDGGGIILFEEVGQAIKGERVVRDGGYDVRLVAPPLELSIGCELALEINLVEQEGVERLFRASQSPYVKITPLTKGATELLTIVKVTDFGKWVMVRSGNMKISFDRETGEIVNISGGGCPDVPYLNVQMVGKRLDEVPQPSTLGYTLCAKMLDRAYEECLRIWKEGDRK